MKNGFRGFDRVEAFLFDICRKEDLGLRGRNPVSEVFQNRYKRVSAWKVFP